MCRGQILGSANGHIWNRKWCFYEIGVGPYKAKAATVGAIGFVAYTNNKDCGNGIWTSFLEKFSFKWAAENKKYVKPIAGNRILLFKYYQKQQFKSFPIGNAAAALAVLIHNSYDKFNSLSV